MKMRGFATVTKTGIDLAVGAANVQNVTLKIGETTEHVTVSAEAAQVESASSDLGALVNQQQMRNGP